MVVSTRMVKIQGASPTERIIRGVNESHDIVNGRNGPIYLAEGDAAVPSLAVRGDEDTGAYPSGADEIAFTAGGTFVAAFKNTAGASQLLMLPGTVAAPAISWYVDPDNGPYRLGTNDVGWSAGGTLTVEFKNTAGAVQTLFAAGTVSAPAISLIGDTNSGFYAVAADRLGATMGGTKVAEFAQAGFGIQDGGAAPTVPLHFSRTATTLPIAIISQLGTAAGDNGMRVTTLGVDAATTVFDAQANGASLFAVMANGVVCIGDNANASMTQGLTINQGANDNEILALKSSDVGHGMTGLTETDTYAYFKKLTAAAGGLLITGLAETGSLSAASLYFQGLSTDVNTTKSTSGGAAVYVDAYLKSGSSVTAISANGGCFAVGNNGAMQFVVDAEGDIAMNATSTINAWDEHDDLALLEAFRVTTANPVNFKRRLSDDLIQRYAQVLHDTGVITLSENGEVFLSVKGMFGLLADTIRQVGAEVGEIRTQIAALPGGRSA